MIAERSRSNAVELLGGWSEGDEIEIHEAMMSLARRNMLETLFDSSSEDLLEGIG